MIEGDMDADSIAASTDALEITSATVTAEGGANDPASAAVSDASPVDPGANAASPPAW